MNPYEILITKDIYDEKDNEKIPEILFGPKIIFAYGKSDAIKKAVIESGISSDDVDNASFYTKEFTQE